MSWNESAAQWYFRHLVLSGIWMLARLIVDKRNAGDITSTWRAEVLLFSDVEGRPGAEEYRRTRTYPIISNGD